LFDKDIYFFMTKQQIIKDFARLGNFLSQFGPKKIERKENIAGNELFFEPMKLLIERAHETNPWFTKDNVMRAMGYWADALQENKIEKWLKDYDIPVKKPKKTGIVMAGNIPLVGLHDLLSVLASGHHAIVKLSSSDNKFIPLLVKYLEHINPEWKGRVEFRDGIMKDADAFIATGSDNSARYFDYYFGKYPHIIRKNRNGVAVLTGDETEKDLEGLADDMMQYFGLGCRNVSKIFVPEGYDLNKIFKASLKYAPYTQHRKYMNNFRYNKAVFTMTPDPAERESLRENGLILFKKDHGYASPVGVIYYEPYENLDDIKKIIQHDKDKIQVVVSKADIPGAIPFGTTQKPELWDYADGVDTMRFLEKLEG